MTNLPGYVQAVNFKNGIVSVRENPPKVLTVGPTGCQFTTIAAALATCTGGEMILISPGTYADPLTITVNVSLIAVSSGFAPVTVTGLVTINNVTPNFVVLAFALYVTNVTVTAGVFSIIGGGSLGTLINNAASGGFFINMGNYGNIEVNAGFCEIMNASVTWTNILSLVGTFRMSNCSLLYTGAAAPPIQIAAASRCQIIGGNVECNPPTGSNASVVVQGQFYSKGCLFNEPIAVDVGGDCTTDAQVRLNVPGIHPTIRPAGGVQFYAENIKTTPDLLADGVGAVVHFADADIYDPMSIHDPTVLVDDHKFFCPAGGDGLWEVSAYIEAEAVAGGSLSASLWTGAGVKLSGDSIYTDALKVTTASMHAFVQLTAGDLVYAWAQQDGVVAGVNVVARMTVRKVPDKLL